MSDEPALTVSEAAQRLACSERTLRRLLARPEYSGRTVTEHRQTKTGTRPARLVPADLLRDLALELLRWEQTPANTGTENTGKNAAEGGNTGAANAGATPADAGRLLMAYERLLQEQQARISDLQAALEHEREQSRRLQDALQREQTLRAIAPASSQPMQGEASEERPAPPDLAPGPGVITSEQASMPSAPARAWWQVWKRRKGDG